MTEEIALESGSETSAVAPELAGAPAQFLHAPDTDAPKARGGELYHGFAQLFSYDAGEIAPLPHDPSGAMAIATLLDGWNVADFGFKRTRAQKYGGNAIDGNMHFPPDYAAVVAQRHPPSGLFGSPISTKEDLVNALRSYGMQASWGHAGAWGKGQAEEQILRDWTQARRPVLCLLDNGQVPNAHPGLYWAIVCGWSDEHVRIATAGNMFSMPWAHFRAAWRCPDLMYPNNFLGIYSYRPA